MRPLIRIANCPRNGPRPIEGKAGFSEKGQLSCQAQFSAWSSEGLSRADVQAMESSIARSLHSALLPSIRLESFPKSSLDLSLIIIERGGSDLSASITASSLALASAGVELYDLVPACQVIRVGDSVILDPSLAEEGDGAYGRAGCLMALCKGKLTACEWQGTWTGMEAKEVIELSIGACEQMKGAMRECLIAQEQA